MYKFKQFILKEELNDKEKKEVSNWERDPKAVKATDHFFGKGNDEKTEELAGTVDKSEVHKAVERHLGREIHPDDYKEGVTNDKYGRKVKIGGVLAKSKADPKLINSFANDSTRQGKRARGLSVKITKSPAGVAGQTSHNQSWENQSCKNYNTGSNNHFLKNEVKHGTVVAYLHDHEGKEIARSTLQPHINDEGHTAYAVDSHYGIDHAGFKQHVKNLAARLSGEHKGGSILYTKHSKVYNDNGAEKILHPNATKEHISKALNDEDDFVRSAAIQHPNATKEHIDKALNDKDYQVRSAAIKHPNATKEHISKALNDEDVFVRSAAIKHPNATKEHISKALNDKKSYVRSVAIQHPNATKEHISKALNDEKFYVRSVAIQHPNATKEHISKALNDEDVSVRSAAKQIKK
jgi:t-SNARE complex subunit (syntaxin)